MELRDCHRAATAWWKIWLAFTATAVGLGVGLTAPVMAAHVARLDVAPTTVAPGGQVTVSSAPSGGYGDTDVTIYWDSLDGPVLGTFPADPFGPEIVTIPPDANVGRHILIANQEVSEEGTGVRGIPARAAIQVTGPGAEVGGGAEDSASGLARLATLRTEGAGFWPLAVVAFVAFAAALAVGALVAARTRRNVGQA